LGESAADTFVKMLENVSSHRALAGLLSVADSKTADVRGKIASLISALITRKGQELVAYKEFSEGLIKFKLEKMLSDQNANARLYAREILETIIEKNLLGSRAELEHLIPPSVIEKGLKERAKDKLKEVGSSSSSPLAREGGTSSKVSGSTPKKRPGRLHVNIVGEGVDTTKVISSAVVDLKGVVTAPVVKDDMDTAFLSSTNPKKYEAR